MKSFFSLACLCVLALNPASAQKPEETGSEYRLKTVRPIHIDMYGRVIPLDPITVWVPVTRYSQLDEPQKTASNSGVFSIESPRREIATVIRPRLAQRVRVASRPANHADVPRTGYGKMGTNTSNWQSRDESSQSAQNGSRKNAVRPLYDSRATIRSVY